MVPVVDVITNELIFNVALEPEPESEPESEPEFELEPELKSEPKPSFELPPGVPPIPEEGLPDGWSLDQWVHYGQRWLDQQNSE